jgi:hypothetical protein
MYSYITLIVLKIFGLLIFSLAVGRCGSMGSDRHYKFEIWLLAFGLELFIVPALYHTFEFVEQLMCFNRFTKECYYIPIHYSPHLKLISPIMQNSVFPRENQPHNLSIQQGEYWDEYNSKVYNFRYKNII